MRPRTGLPGLPASRLLKPADVLSSVLHITPEFMAARGLRGLLLDLDNTLVPYRSYEDVPGAARWVAELSGSGLRLSLLSNAAPQRAEEWRRRLGLGGVGLAGKPNPAAFRRAAASLDLAPCQVGMVGDQVFTDVLGGNLAGLHTILVHPLIDNALPHTRLARALERRVLARHGHDWGPGVWQPASLGATLHSTVHLSQETAERGAAPEIGARAQEDA